MAASKFDKRLHPWTPRGKETKIGLRGKRAGDPEAKVAVPDDGEPVAVIRPAEGARIEVKGAAADGM